MVKTGLEVEVVSCINRSPYTLYVLLCLSSQTTVGVLGSRSGANVNRCSISDRYCPISRRRMKGPLEEVTPANATKKVH